jgi:hypothetical protein
MTLLNWPESCRILRAADMLHRATMYLADEYRKMEPKEYHAVKANVDARLTLIYLQRQVLESGYE